MARSSTELFENDVHPRLFFGPDDVPALRRKAQAGIPGQALREMLRRCEGYTDPKSPDFVDVAAGRGQAGDALHCLAFAHVLTGEAAWAEHGAAMLRTLAGGGSGPSFEGAVSVVLAYDLLHGTMAEADRAAVRRWIRADLVDGFIKRLDRPAGYLWGLGTNIVIHSLSHHVLALAATYDPECGRPALERADGLVRRSFHVGMDEGGAIGEGPSYGWGDADCLSVAAEVLRRAGVSDLWAEEPRFAAMCRHWAYLILPGGRGQNTIGDAWRLAADLPHWASLLHARRLNDPVLQWVWEQLKGRAPNPAGRSAPERFETNLGCVVLWEDDKAVSQRPDEAGWPGARCSGEFGQIVMRSGWGDDDLYFSLLAAGRRQGCHIHQHVDGGHFCLFALGEAFSIDSGYGDIQGRFHSLVMPNGQERQHAPLNDFDNMFFGGRAEAFGTGDGADYACVDVARQWECITARRRALLVRAPGADPYVVLLDYFNLSNRAANYLWLMNSEPGNAVQPDQEHGRATVTGRRNRLEVCWGYPRAEDYPERHMLEVEWDEIHSFPLAHRNVDVDYFQGRAAPERPGGYGRWGAGRRPRIKATLWGYNEQLLTALVPRRAAQPPVEFERIGACAHFGLVLRLGDVTDTIVASPLDGGIDLGGLRGEAALAVARRDAAGRLLWWGAAEVYALQVDGRQVLPRRGVPETLASGAP